MQATLMNYSYRHHPAAGDRFSPSSTSPSPPVYYPKCRPPPTFLPYFHPHKFLPQVPRVRKMGFTIEELLGIGGGERDAYDGYKGKQYADATPRSALTALLPQSPEKSPEKYDSKTLSKPRHQPDDPETTALYDILSPPKPAPKSPPSHGGGKMKRIRTIFTPEQLERLEAEFERQQYMVGPDRLYLASSLNLSESQVKIWFQNRRIKWRKQHLEMQQARLAQMREGGGSPIPGGEQPPVSPPTQQWDE